MQLRPVGIKCRDTQRIELTQQLLQYVGLWNLRLGSGEILAFDRLVNLVPMHRNVPRSIDSDLYIAASDIEDRNLNFIAYDETFILFSCED